MNRWKLVLANPEQIFWKKLYIEQEDIRNVKHWNKVKKNNDKETPKTFNICDLPKNFLDAASKENIEI